MITVYAISSIKRAYIYVGLTSQLNIRIIQHQNGNERTTKPYRPYRLIYTKEFENRRSAREFEKYLKSGSGKEFFKSIRDSS